MVDDIHSRAMSHTKTHFKVRAMSHSQVFAAIVPVVIQYSVTHHWTWYMDKHYYMGNGPTSYDVWVCM